LGQAGIVRPVDAAILTAPAKLTRRLRITGRRDDGYHLLDAEMVSIDLADELEITAAPATSLEISDEVDWCGRVPDATSLPAGPNLVESALAAAGVSARVRLTKRIPAGAGLGGGSADAAAVLRWAGCRDLGVAARIGADVPFCVGGGRARVGGIGEVIEPLAYEPADILLVVPNLHVSTPAVYFAWDSLGGPRGEHGNDLEPAALVAEPRLAWWRDLVADVAGDRPRLAGSGGAWWIEGAGPRLRTLQRQMAATIEANNETALVTVVRTIRSS
jgi:4-diphosphocytidyl-2-C-methyl-D-erythritol kinase